MRSDWLILTGLGLAVYGSVFDSAPAMIGVTVCLIVWLVAVTVRWWRVR